MKLILQNIALEIRKIAFEGEAILLDLPEDITLTRLNRQGRNIKHIIGHLIDTASYNHQIIVRLQYTSNLRFPGFSAENEMWISIQQHQEEDWKEMLLLWKYFNLHIAHIISCMDESWLENEMSDGQNDPLSLRDVIFEYLAHLTLHINEIKVLLKQKTYSDSH